MSWKELYERYDEFKDLSMEELSKQIGEWWAYIFISSKEDIRVGRWRREDKKDEGGSCDADSCPIDGHK